ENDTPVYLIDAAKYKTMFGYSFLDDRDPETEEIIKTYRPTEEKAIPATGSTGMYLRNRFMAARIKAIAKESAHPVLIVQTGRIHLAGQEKFHMDYRESLHGLLMDALPPDVKIITLFPELKSGESAGAYKTILS